MTETRYFFIMHATTILNLGRLKKDIYIYIYFAKTHSWELMTSHVMPCEPKKKKKGKKKYTKKSHQRLQVLFGLGPIMECEMFCAATKCI